jgi:hypothetical protein
MGTDIHGVFQRKHEGRWEDVPSNFEFNRHYFLFSFLGGVRNGFGFAGVKTYDRVQPVAENRGLPKDFEMVGDDHPIKSLDILPAWRRKYQEPNDLHVWMGDHSYSWATGEEILAHSLLLAKTKRVGVVSRAWYDAWDKLTPPESYSGMIMGPGVVVGVDGQDLTGATHVQIAWREDDLAQISYFLDEVERLMKEHSEIRFVFGFDS